MRDTRDTQTQLRMRSVSERDSGNRFPSIHACFSCLRCPCDGCWRGPRGRREGGEGRKKGGKEGERDAAQLFISFLPSFHEGARSRAACGGHFAFFPHSPPVRQTAGPDTTLCVRLRERARNFRSISLEIKRKRNFKKKQQKLPDFVELIGDMV